MTACIGSLTIYVWPVEQSQYPILSRGNPPKLIIALFTRESLARKNIISDTRMYVRRLKSKCPTWLESATQRTRELIHLELVVA